MMKKKINVLIVAKPWQGGLQNYYYNAFSRNINCSVKIIYSYPNNIKDYLSYKLNKTVWIKKTLDRINSYNYDFGFYINTADFLKYVKNKNNCLYLTDNPTLDKIYKENIIKIFISDLGYKKKIKIKDRNIEELPFGLDPIIHKPQRRKNDKKLICSIMNKDPERDKCLQEILNKGYKIDIYGNYFLRHKFFYRNPNLFYPSIKNHTQEKIYSKYLISLNIHAGILLSGTNMRTFEASGYKIAQLINYRPGLDKFFEPDKEILVFSNISEFETKLDRLVNDKKFYRKIIESSNKRAITEHTYDQRVIQVLSGFN